MRPVLALDIGGANLKAAHTTGELRVKGFEVWRKAAQLEQVLGELMASMPSFDLLAVTMTAELCDCFQSKADGVAAVLGAVEGASHQRAIPIKVWCNDGQLVTPEQARAEPLRAAASNWMALAIWAGRYCGVGPALLIDIGSTTTDIIPLRGGIPVPKGRTDLERLGCGELVYSGIRRTPVCALLGAIKLRGGSYRVAAELFVTTLDVYLLLGELPDAPDDLGTADGRPATRRWAKDRLARSICGDRTMLRQDEIKTIARQVASAQLEQLRRACGEVEGTLGARPETVVLSGEGEFLGRSVCEPLRATVVSLTQQLGPGVSRVACAYALSVLASEGEW